MGDHFDESQPRDARGEWTSGGGGGAAKAATTQESHANMDKITNAVHGAGFSESHIAKLREDYAKINTVDPSGKAYQKLTGTLDKMSQPQLKQLAGAKIKFISGLARNRVKG